MYKDHDFVPFLSAESRCRFADGVILGCPYEDPASFRRGAFSAADGIRRFSQHISTFHPETGTCLEQWNIEDKGNMVLCDLSEEVVFSQLEKTASGIFAEKKFLLTLGGTRAVSYPLIRAAKTAYPQLKVISLDAHSGLEIRSSGPISHDNLFSALLEDTLVSEDLCQWGIRVGSRDALERCYSYEGILPPRVKKGILEEMHRLYKYPIYLTIDIDVMDPPFAPGSGHPVYGGIGTTELFETIALLQSLHIVGMDLTEIVPAYDRSGITEILGATIVKEALIHFLPKSKKKC